MMCPRLALPLLALLGAAAFGPPPEAERAVPGQRPGFVHDGAGGCWIWVGGLPATAEGITGRWSGACPEGPAEGEGRAVTAWREGGREKRMVYEGPLRRGKAEGQGRLQHFEAERLVIEEEGEYRDDYLVGGRFSIPGAGLVYEGGWFRSGPHGQGRLTVQGRSFEGRWELGCLDTGRAWIAFTRPPESCADQAT